MRDHHTKKGKGVCTAFSLVNLTSHTAKTAAFLCTDGLPTKVKQGLAGRSGGNLPVFVNRHGPVEQPKKNLNSAISSSAQL